MIIADTETVDLSTATGPMRSYIFRPVAGGRYPGLVLYSEIYQVTGPIRRIAVFLAGHGFVVRSLKSIMSWSHREQFSIMINLTPTVAISTKLRRRSQATMVTHARRWTTSILFHTVRGNLGSWGFALGGIWHFARP